MQEGKYIDVILFIFKGVGRGKIIIGMLNSSYAMHLTAQGTTQFIDEQMSNV